MIEPIYSPEEVSTILNTDVERVKTLMKEKQIKAKKTGNQWRTTHSALVEYILEESDA